MLGCSTDRRVDGGFSNRWKSEMEKNILKQCFDILNKCWLGYARNSGKTRTCYFSPFLEFWGLRSQKCNKASVLSWGRGVRGRSWGRGR